MNSTGLTLEEEIRISTNLLTSSYDIASGGIPPHLRLFQMLLEGKPLDENAGHVLKSKYDSNLLWKPGLTMPGYNGTTEADCYFGQHFRESLWNAWITNYRFGELEEAAILRKIAHPRIALDLTTAISANEIPLLVQGFHEQGYLLKLPKPSNEWHLEDIPNDMLSLMLRIQREGGRVSEGIMGAFIKSNQYWQTEPLFTNAVQTHLSKLKMMMRIFDHVTGKMKLLEFADPQTFDYPSYFGVTDNDIADDITKMGIAYLSKFGRQVPSALELLEWGNTVLASAKQKYAAVA